MPNSLNSQSGSVSSVDSSEIPPLLRVRGDLVLSEPDCPNSSLAAVILAGGQSSRMGQDKALITLGGKPMLWRICHLASQCASQVYVITPWPERYQDILPDGTHLIPEVWSPGQTKPHGPLLGFAQALSWIATEWVLLLACDLPQLTSAALPQWLEYLPAASPATIALLPRSPKGWEPLCGFYRCCCLPLLQEYLNQGGQSFQGWLAQYPVQELPVSDRQLLFNCNTPVELKQAGFLSNLST